MEKDKLIKREYDRIKKLYSELPKNELSLNDGLFQNAAFMKATLAELQEIINTDGPVIDGKENPAQRSYNNMINRYGTVIKQLNAMLPPEVRKSKLEALMDE